MFYGFSISDGKVQFAVKSEKEDEVMDCCPPSGAFVVVNTPAGVDKVSNAHLVVINNFLVGGSIKKFEDRKTAMARVQKNIELSESKFEKAKGFKIPETEDPSPEPIEETGAEVEPETESSTDEKETEDMATKGKKTANKKAAKKTTAKTAGTGSRGRKPRIDLDAKLRAKVKENPFRGGRAKMFDIILKNPGITVRDFLKKGGKTFDLGAFTKEGGTKNGIVVSVG